MNSLKFLPSIVSLSLVVHISSSAFAMDDWKGSTSSAPALKHQNKEQEPVGAGPKTQAVAPIGKGQSTAVESGAAAAAVSTSLAAPAALLQDTASNSAQGAVASTASEGGTAAGSASQTLFKSGIFTYTDLAAARGMKVSLKGKGWHANSVTEADIAFHQALFSNKIVMAGFAEAQPRDPAATATRLRTQWLPRFVAGQPHGGLTVFDTQSGKPIGHVVAGGGDAPGVSEVAYSYLPEFWGKGIGTGVIGTIVQEWAPEVRRIGLGQGLDAVRDAAVIKAFQCFGTKPLNQLDGTASPSNPRSWKILDKFKFEAAAFKVLEKNSKDSFDFDGKELTFEGLEGNLLKLYDAAASSTPLVAGVRYRLIDPQGKVRTFSKHNQYNRMKFHFELRLN